MNSLIDAYRKCLLLNNSNKLYYLSTSAILSSEVVNTIYRRRVIIWFICKSFFGWLRNYHFDVCGSILKRIHLWVYIYICVYAVHPVNYAHSYGLVWANFTHIIQGYSLARGQSYDSLSVCEATLKNMGEYSVKYLRTIYMKNGTSQFNPYWY